ncbi:MAG TPA: hypothetical protein VFB43_13185 [Terracidiphilus sp.]|nr:hypothetical protein [Terracidiphilus sp.]
MAQTVNISQVNAVSGTVSDVKIDQIVLGGVTIGQLVLQGTSLNLAAGSAFLDNVRIVVTLDFAFDWWINLGFWSDSGSANVGSLSFGLSLGNVSIPSLNNVPLSVPNVVIANLSAVVAPVTAIDLGGATFGALAAANIALPKNGFTLSGLGLGAISLASLQIPETAVGSLSVQDFHPNAKITLPNASVGPIQIPSASVPDIQGTAPVNVTGTASQQSLGMNLGVLGGSLNITPTAYVSIGALQLQNVALSGAVTQAILENIGVPVDIRGINLNTIDIGQINAVNLAL